MMHVHYDLSLVIGSVAISVLACYFAVSVEQMLFQNVQQQLKKIALIMSGLLLGAAVWSMHFVGMLACQLPAPYQFDLSFTTLSFVIAFIASTFAVWLTTQSTLPVARLILSGILMGLGISGMHYTGMMGIQVEGYRSYYDPTIVLLSVLVAIGGAILTFWFMFHSKCRMGRQAQYKIFIAVLMSLSIVAMHYIGMEALHFYSTADLPQSGHFQIGQGPALLVVILVTSLIFAAAVGVSLLELRLEEKSRQLSLANRELANQAVKDNLTKLPNRLYLAEYAQLLFSEHRQKNTKIAFLYIDLDRFKAVNDVFGHHVGDQLLIQLSKRVQSHLGENTQLLRIGGDEFLLVIEHTDIAEATVISEKILELIQQSFLIAGKVIHISGSIGIAMYPEHGTNLQDILMNADAAMLTSKYQGRNTSSIFNYDLELLEAKSQSKLINDLYKAVEQQQFALFYQPKFKAADHKICGVEALIRWYHPVHGLLTPNMFIKGAEKTGLIIQIGYWTLEEAFKQIQIWERSGAPLFPVAVNLSAVQFEHKHLFSTLENLFKRYEIQPHHLMIEVTESTAMHHIESSIRSFERLRQMGIQLAIDDFGTGHSSFLYLKKLPVDELKIDRAFILDLCLDSKEELILESIIQLAIKLGLTVTAEGVETPLQAEILTRLGCQQLQGYLLGLPMDVERLEELFKHSA